MMTWRARRCCRCTPRRTTRSASAWSGALSNPLAAVVGKEQPTYLAEAIAELPERLRIVVEQYFLAERPMGEIAATLGVTESRISQLRAEAPVLLRDALNL